MMYCTNKHCVAKIHDKISNFASREAMNIVGISEERLRILMEHKYITDFASLYNIHQFKDEIAKIDGFGKVSVENLIAAIEAIGYTYGIKDRERARCIGNGWSADVIAHIFNCYKSI